MAERIVKTPAFVVEIDTPGSGIVMVNLHHGRKHTVIILAKQLTDDHFIDTHLPPDSQFINLQMVFRFHHAKGIFYLLLSDTPASTGDKAADKVQT